MPSFHSIPCMAGLALGLMMPRSATSLHQVAKNLDKGASRVATAASHFELTHHARARGDAKLVVAPTGDFFDFDNDVPDLDWGVDDEVDDLYFSAMADPTGANKLSQPKHKTKWYKKSVLERLFEKTKESGELARKPWHMVEPVNPWEEKSHFAEHRASHAVKAAPHAESHSPKVNEPFLFDHMPKTGGTYLMKLFNSAVGSQNFEKRSEFANVTQDDIDNNFIVGSVRNPCDYYLSLWAYGVEHGGAMKHTIRPASTRDYVYHTTSKYKNSTEDIRRFRRWVRLISKKGHPGVMSIRFAQSYAVLEKAIPAAFPPQHLKKDELDTVARALATPDYKNRVNCWVKAEKLGRGASECLNQWHTLTGRKINWRGYNEALGHANRLESSHGRCRDYFTYKLAQAVRDLEAPIFRDFDYRGCCAK